MLESIKIYEFAASIGSFEGYVYGKRAVEEINMAALDNWSGNIVSAYNHLPDSIKDDIRHRCDLTVGRAIRSIEPVLGSTHPITERLYSILSPEAVLPESADAFDKKKWFTDDNRNP